MDCFINVLRPGCSIAGEKLPQNTNPWPEPRDSVAGRYFYPSLRILLKLPHDIPWPSKNLRSDCGWGASRLNEPWDLASIHDLQRSHMEPYGAIHFRIISWTYDEKHDGSKNDSSGRNSPAPFLMENLEQNPTESDRVSLIGFEWAAAQLIRVQSGPQQDASRSDFCSRGCWDPTPLPKPRQMSGRGTLGTPTMWVWTKQWAVEFHTIFIDWLVTYGDIICIYIYYMIVLYIFCVEWDGMTMHIWISCAFASKQSLHAPHLKYCCWQDCIFLYLKTQNLPSFTFVFQTPPLEESVSTAPILHFLCSCLWSNHFRIQPVTRPTWHAPFPHFWHFHTFSLLIFVWSFQLWRSRHILAILGTSHAGPPRRVRRLLMWHRRPNRPHGAARSLVPGESGNRGIQLKLSTEFQQNFNMWNNESLAKWC